MAGRLPRPRIMLRAELVDELSVQAHVEGGAVGWRHSGPAADPALCQRTPSFRQGCRPGCVLGEFVHQDAAVVVGQHVDEPPGPRRENGEVDIAGFSSDPSVGLRPLGRYADAVDEAQEFGGLDVSQVRDGKTLVPPGAELREFAVGTASGDESSTSPEKGAVASARSSTGRPLAASSRPRS